MLKREVNSSYLTTAVFQMFSKWTNLPSVTKDGKLRWTIIADERNTCIHNWKMCGRCDESQLKTVYLIALNFLSRPPDVKIASSDFVTDLPVCNNNSPTHYNEPVQNFPSVIKYIPRTIPRHNFSNIGPLSASFAISSDPSEKRISPGGRIMNFTASERLLYAIHFVPRAVIRRWLISILFTMPVDEARARPDLLKIFLTSRISTSTGLIEQKQQQMN